MYYWVEETERNSEMLGDERTVLIGGTPRDLSRTRSQIERERWTCGPDALSMPLDGQTLWLELLGGNLDVRSGIMTKLTWVLSLVGLSCSCPIVITFNRYFYQPV